jgi:aminopeptidase
VSNFAFNLIQNMVPKVLFCISLKPRFILDMATLTGAVRVALGDCVTAIFSNSDSLWESIQEAGKQSGDRVWRMPLYSHYSNQMTEHEAYDINNLGKGKNSISSKIFTKSTFKL